MSPRFVLGLFVVVVVVGALLYYALQAYVKSQQQKYLARYAAELLEYHDIPGPVIAWIVEQGRQLEEAEKIMRATVHEDNYDARSSIDAMQAWLEGREAVQKKLSK